MMSSIEAKKMASDMYNKMTDGLRQSNTVQWSAVNRVR